MRLMDEKQETGSGNPDLTEYRQRTLGILNVLRHELYPYSSTFEQGRSCPELGQFDQALDLDDDLAQAVLPYGLAAHLLLGEDNTAASFFQQRYTELLYGLGCRRKATWEQIVV